MGAGKAYRKDEYVDINHFLEEMVSIIERRLSAQEDVLSKLESEVKGIRAEVKAVSGKKGARGMRVDRSVMKVIRQ